MRKIAFAVAVALVALVWHAEAGEMPLSKCGGTIEVTDAGVVNNITTAGAGFTLTGNQPISIQCIDAGASVLPNTATGCAPGAGIVVPAGGLLDDTIGATVLATRWDGGVVNTGLVCISALPGASAAKCQVFCRAGGEGK